MIVNGQKQIVCVQCMRVSKNGSIGIMEIDRMLDIILESVKGNSESKSVMALLLISWCCVC